MVVKIHGYEWKNPIEDSTGRRYLAVDAMFYRAGEVTDLQLAAAVPGDDWRLCPPQSNIPFRVREKSTHNLWFLVNRDLAECPNGFNVEIQATVDGHAQVVREPHHVDSWVESP